MYQKIDCMQVVIEGKNGGDEYLIRCLDMDQNQQEVTAGALNLNGYAFATSGMEIGEHKRTVTVEKEHETSSYVNIKTEVES